MEETASAAAAPRPGCRTITGMALGLVAALAFVALTAVRLDAQGPQYDELHQAPAAFVHLGSPAEMFALLNVNGYPVMNMQYSAALKSHLYGLFLRGRGEFVLAEWRLFGILIVAAGIVLFAVLAAPALPPLGLGLLLVLLVTDGSLLVLGRHDWGPVDLALLLRLLLIGSWLRGEATGPTLRNSFGLGAIAGIAIFEKLSSVALLVALVLFFAASRTRRDRRHLAACALGLAAGLLPLLAINVASYVSSQTIFSLANKGGGAVEHTWAGLAAAAHGTLGLGAGSQAAQLILGLPPAAQLMRAEALLATVNLLAAAGVALYLARRQPAARWAAVALASFLGVILAVFLLPPRTWVHHWIIAITFLDVGVALALTAALQAWRKNGGKLALPALALLAAGWLACRVPAVVRIEQGLARGSASLAFHPSLSRLAEFAANRADQAIFVASDWGVATQIYCFGNGRPGLVYQPFWWYRGIDWLEGVQEASGKKLLYLVRLEPPANVKPEVTAQIESDLTSSPHWREVPVEPDAARLEAVKVRKLVYVGG